MANEKNLKHKLTVSEQRKGGKKSGEVRREKKTIKAILTDLIESDVKDVPQFAELASKWGITEPKSIKDIFTLICVLNGARKGDLSDLDTLAHLLGEESRLDLTENAVSVRINVVDKIGDKNEA